jgi:hypothetical protein
MLPRSQRHGEQISHPFVALYAQSKNYAHRIPCIDPPRLAGGQAA